MGKQHNQKMYDQKMYNVQSFVSNVNIQEFKDVGKSQMSNIIMSGIGLALYSYYNNDNQQDMLKKIGIMMTGQLIGSSLTDMLHKSGKIDDVDGNVAKIVEVVTASGFYSIVALRGLKLPNVRSRQYQEAILGSVAGIYLGPFIQDQINQVKQEK